MMHQPRLQRTLAATARIEGFGFLSGQDVHVELRPAAPGTGIVFVRHDLPRSVRIPASVAHRVETPRRTTLAHQGAQVGMVEHLLAALGGLHVDNCEVYLDAAELPGCDGSALPLVEAILAAGIVTQPARRGVLVVHEITRIGTDEAWVEARPTAGMGMSVNFRLDYGPASPIGRQALSLPITPDSFRRELAPARTFMLKAEAERMQAQGLGMRTTCRDLLVYGEEGPLDNTLRFSDECVRHKALDLVGDLTLAGCDIVGHIVAYRSGHRLNAELVRAMLNQGTARGDLKRTA